MLRRHWLPLLGLNSVVLSATIYAAIHASMTIPPIWKANAELNLPQTTGDVNASLGTLGNVQSKGVDFKGVNPLEIQLAILTSNIVLERVRALDPEKSLYSNLGSYKKLFEVIPKPDSSLISLAAQGTRPDLAYKRVTALTKIYQQRLNELRHNDADARELFAQADLNKARINLKQTQTALAKFQQSTGLISPSDQTKGLIGAINELKTTQATIIAQAQANATQAQATAASLGTTPQKAMNSLRLGENKDYQAVRQKVSEIETALAEARGTYTDESPLVQSLLGKRQELLRELNQRIATAIPGAQAEEVDTTLGGNGSSRDSRIDMIADLIKSQTTAQGLQQQANQIQSQINKLNTELNSIAINQGYLVDLQRRYEIAEGVYKGIIAQIQQGNTNPFNVYPNVQVLDEPTIDPKPSVPSRRLIAYGGILAAIFGSMALILFLETRNPLLSPKDLQQVEFPILGRISRLKHPNMERALGADIEIDFQRLASAILMLENQRLMVTSATSGEGKTTVTLGLALALVNFGFRVLVVDGDLRQAEMSRRLRYFKTEIKANSKQTPVHIYPGLDLIPAPNIPRDKIAEFFARGSFERCLKVAQDSGCYDYVLVDSAPVGLASETNLMSTVVRNVLFVVRSGTSDRYPVMESFEQLIRHNALIRGLVINGVESQTEGYRYGYGHQRELVETEA
jgi:uncharacterized protein involved in exopolysaccharide biosynthesis/Mrp family chromosome partitioning ATPase